MLVSRVFSRVARRASSLNQCRLLVSSSRQELPSLNLSSEFGFVPESHPKVASFNHLLYGTTSSGSWLSSSAIPEPSEKETNKPADGQAPVTEEETPKASAEAKRENDMAYIHKLEFLLAEKEELFKDKRAEMNRMQDSVLRSYADTLEIMDGTRRESANSKKIAIQNFAKSLLDVADNLGRASAVVKDGFSKIDQTKDSAGAVPLLKTLLEGVEMTNKQLAEVTSFHHLVIGSTSSRSWLSSSASPEPSSEKETNKPADGQAPVADEETPKASAEAKDAEKIADTDSDSDSDSELESESDRFSSYIDQLETEIAEIEELLKKYGEEMNHLQDIVLRGYADTLEIMDRTRRKSENSKKFAIQNFAKSLLDVADNLGRASAVVKDSFSKIDQTKDSAGAVPLLKTLLEGVEMTNKQLAEVFRKYGVEKYDPMNEQFDRNRHYAVFQLADASKPSGTVAAVLKLGYMLHDRVIRPAEVGVTEEAPNNGTERHWKIKEKNHPKWNAQFAVEQARKKSR